MEPRARVLVLPIFRRYWLWHADRALVAAAPEAAGKALKSWREGRNLEEKLQLLGQSTNVWVQRRLWAEWGKLERAKEGSFRNRGYRMAQAVLAREDPRETFLKNLPAQPAPINVVFPTAYKERLVRRRLRHLVADGRRRHTMRLLWWSLAMLPQLPLMLTPLPNLTVYYTGYRIYSHYRALQGGKMLQQSLEQLSSKQLRDLRDQLLMYQDRRPGFQFPADQWPAKLIKKEPVYLDMLEHLTLLERRRQLQLQAEAAALEGGEQEHEQLQRGLPDKQPELLLTFTPSQELNDLVKPAERLQAPLSDDAAIAVGKLFDVKRMIEYVARARRRAVGSMFPADLQPSPQHRPAS